MSLRILSIGHSNRTVDQLVGLLASTSVNAIADVRSVPYSRYAPQHNGNELRYDLSTHGIAYSFLGDELGGRPAKPSLFTYGVADYTKMAQQSSFSIGLDRLIRGMQNYHIAMMCSELNPLECHRCLLIGRALRRYRIDVEHIVDEATILSQTDIERHLVDLQQWTLEEADLSYEQRLDVAYRRQAERYAYRDGAQEARQYG